MKESHSEGVASHADLESCGGDRKVAVEALTEARMGQPLSREMHAERGADAVVRGGRPHRSGRYCKTRMDPARSETLRTYGTFSHGNWEVPRPAMDVTNAMVRTENPQGVRR